MSIEINTNDEMAEFVKVRHGKWERHPDYLWECSECGHMIFSKNEFERKHSYAFCSKCGARMDGEEHDNT